MSVVCAKVACSNRFKNPYSYWDCLEMCCVSCWCRVGLATQVWGNLSKGCSRDSLLKISCSLYLFICCRGTKYGSNPPQIDPSHWGFTSARAWLPFGEAILKKSKGKDTLPAQARLRHLKDRNAHVQQDWGPGVCRQSVVTVTGWLKETSCGAVFRGGVPCMSSNPVLQGLLLEVQGILSLTSMEPRLYPRYLMVQLSYQDRGIP